MKPAMRVWLSAVLCGLVGIGSGCAIVADIFDPDFAGTLGFATNEVTGTVIVVFQNDTGAAAEFNGFAISDANGTESAPFTQLVTANSSNNVVLDCPIYSVDLGTAGDGLVSDKNGATVFDADGNVDVPYGGDALVVPDYFECGDVIVVRLVQSTTTTTTDENTETQVAYTFQVEVVPGG